MLHPMNNDTLLMMMTDIEDSPTDNPDLWMSERNEEDTNFVRTSTDSIPTKRNPPPGSEQEIVQQRNFFFNIW